MRRYRRIVIPEGDLILLEDFLRRAGLIGMIRSNLPRRVHEILLRKRGRKRK